MAKADPEHIKLLDRIVAAAEAGEPEDLLNIYAADGVIWHNTDNREQTVEQNMRVLVSIGKILDNRKYSDRRVHVFDGGVVQQHTLRGTRRSDGAEVELKACVVVLVEDGKITRLDEYFDSVEAAQIRA